MADSFWYPSVDGILDIQDDLVLEYPDASPGIQSRGDIEFALEKWRAITSCETAAIRRIRIGGRSR